MQRIPLESIWRVFAKQYQLSEMQVSQFESYAHELLKWNQQCDLTAITNEHDVVELHFDDSLKVTQFMDFSKITSCCDVGSGAGFPGIPLKILYPHLTLYLLEVQHKRVEFLEYMVDTLKLDNVLVMRVDWRTFLRKTEFGIDLFCARASLDPEELIRMFKPSCVYNDVPLIYWASRMWKSVPKVESYIKTDWEYHVGGRKRRLILLQNK